MAQGRKQTLKEPEKQIIREMYAKRIGSQKILAVIKEINPNAKRHHIWNFAWQSGITKQYKERPVKAKEGYFDLIEYSRTVATI